MPPDAPHAGIPEAIIAALGASPADGRITAEDIYRKLVEESSSKQRRDNLEILWSVLSEQKERKATDYSVALISRLTKARGGLSESSIRNVGGAHYRHLISAFAEENGRGKRAKVKAASWEEEVVSNVGDPALRARILLVLAENRKLRGELNLLRNAVHRGYIVPDVSSGHPAPMQDGSPTSASSNTRPEGGEVVVLQDALLPQELRAVESFLSRDHLEANGWVVTEAGGIRKGAGAGPAIAKPGFVPALRKLTTSSG